MRSEGEILWVHSQAELSFDAAGNLERLLGTSVDITERVLTEKDLEARHDRLEEVIENAPLNCKKATTNCAASLCWPLTAKSV